MIPVDCESTRDFERGGYQMTNTALLNDLIAKSGLKKGYIAEQIGLSAYGFAKKVNNVTEFKTSEVNKLCELLKIETLEEKERIFFAVKVD